MKTKHTHKFNQYYDGALGYGSMKCKCGLDQNDYEEMKNQHTLTLKLPLKSSQMSAYVIQDANGTNVIRIENILQQECYQLEALIVRAVNSHEVLLKVLKRAGKYIDALSYGQAHEFLDLIDETIAQAEGK